MSMRALWVTLRVLLGIGGGYAASAAWSAALAVVLYRSAGFERAESAVLSAMLGFAFYLFALLWAFTTPRLSRVALVFGSGSLLGYGIIVWLSPAPVGATLSSLLGSMAG
jgi:hypothetical protein